MNYKIFYPKNIYKNLKKLNFIQFTMIIIIILLFYIVIYTKKNEPFDNNSNMYTHLLDNNIYDSFYCKYYDKIFLDKNKNQYEIDFITNIVKDKNNSVLDIGCGTGNHVNYLTEYFKNTIGIDQSIHMINTAKEKYPHCNYKHIDIFNIENIIIDDNINDNIIDNNIYNIVTCFGKTIYCIQDKHKFFDIIYNILETDGLFFVHLIDKNNFSPQNSNKDKNNILFDSRKYNNDNKINKYIIKFKQHEYSSEYIINDNYNNDDNNNQENDLHIPYAKYIEKFINNENINNVRKNEINLYLPDNITLINLIKDKGFKYHKKLDLANVGYISEYIYAFKKI